MENWTCSTTSKNRSLLSILRNWFSWKVTKTNGRGKTQQHRSCNNHLEHHHSRHQRFTLLIISLGDYHITTLYLNIMNLGGFVKRVQLYNHSLLCMYHALLFDEGEQVTYIIWQLLLASCESQPTNFKTLWTVIRPTFSMFWRGQVMFLHTTTDYYFLIVCHFPLNLLYILCVQMDMTCIPFSRVSTTLLAWKRAS